RQSSAYVVKILHFTSEIRLQGAGTKTTTVERRQAERGARQMTLKLKRSLIQRPAMQAQYRD
ncbi:MAG: hypothetical protein VW831_13810, partial [Gammaproteobacteria bacterium]